MNTKGVSYCSMSENSPYFEQDEPSGKISQKYTDEEFLEAVRVNSPASTSEVAEAVGSSQDNTYRRLKALEDADKVDSKMAGNSLIWFPQ